MKPGLADGVTAVTAAGGFAPELPVMVVRPSHGWVSLRLRELWGYRELLYFLVWRDIKVRYKQTVLGAAWAIIQPMASMLIFSLFFGRLAKMPSDGVPYPLFSFSALVPWTFFATSLTQSSASLVGSSNLIKKVYFPRLVIPMSSSLSGLVDVALSFSVLLVLMAYFGFYPTAHIVWLLPLLLLAMVTSLGVSLWLSALNVQYRDVHHTIPFLTQMWLFATPDSVPEQPAVGALAHDLRAQSHGRGGRRIPLGPPRG